MPRYELCYILAASVSDDQVPATTSQIKQFITDFGGTDVEEQQLGKKKLAYPIKKTRNGFYVVDQFTMDSRKINDFEAKIRAQTATIIRHLIINLDEFLIRSEKDKVEQSKLSKRPAEGEEEVIAPVEQKTTPTPVVTEKPEGVTKEPVTEEKPKVEISETELDQKIDEALSEDIK